MYSKRRNNHLPPPSQTGALTNVIERGTKGIGTVLTMVLFSIFPTLLELGMVSAVLWWSVGPQFAATAFTTVVVYMIFTTQVAEGERGLWGVCKQLRARANFRTCPPVSPTSADALQSTLSPAKGKDEAVE